MGTTNQLWINTGQRLEALQLLPDTALLPTFQANDRTKSESIQSDYSPEFEAPGTAHNHRLLRHAAASQPTQGQAYARLPCVLTSGGVEILPLGLLYVKGYKEGRYQLQLAGGNRRLVEALGDRSLADLDLTRFDHAWTPANVLAGLPYAHWATQGWGYEVYDRGKPVDLQNLSPYDLYPSVAGQLVFNQILADAGFTADDISQEPLFAALNVPTANPYTYPQAFRDARRLQAGFFHVPNYDLNKRAGGVLHEQPFPAERLTFSYTERAPYYAPAGTSGANYFAGRYTASTLGYYDLAGSVTLRFGSDPGPYGRVRCFMELRVNGQPVFDAQGQQLGKEELEGKDYVTHTFAPKLSHYKLQAGDYVELWWRGDAIRNATQVGPYDPYWQIGPWGSQTPLHYPAGSTLPDLSLANEVQFTVTLLPEFPEGGLVKLADWLPDMKQLDFVKTYMLLGGLTIQADPYTNHLRLRTGAQLLANVPQALDWTRKRAAFASPGRLPERELAYRFGSYGQRNLLKWAEDEQVTADYGNGTLLVADEVLPASYDLATLPFAATEPSPTMPGLLLLANFEKKEVTATDYSAVTIKPRLTLRRADGVFSGRLITTPATDTTAAVLTGFVTTASYFVGAGVSLLLNGTVLTDYYADLRAMLDQSRYLTERYRLTPADIAALDYAVPIWDGVLGDFFAVSAVSEYDARRAVEVKLVRLNATHLPPPALPATGLQEWWGAEFYNAEWY